MTIISHRIFALLFGVATSTLCLAQSPLSYDMLNGDGVASGGSFNYWDLSYNGTGNTMVDSAPLSGGLGDLTDGVIATDNWFMTENTGGTGPYVGWSNFDSTVTFHFNGPTNIDTLTVWADDSDHTGGVNLPGGVFINGTLYDVDEDMAGSAPKALTFMGLGLNTDTVELTFVRTDTWVMVSEVQFGVVPEPATLTVFGLTLTVALKRKRRS